MKKILMRTSLVLLLLVGMVSTASALPITGGLAFSGGFATNTGDFANATAFTSFSGVEVTTTGLGYGTFVGFVSGTPLLMPGFSFNPLPASPQILWDKIGFNSRDYYFYITSVDSRVQGSDKIDLAGKGYFIVTGVGPAYDQTPGRWILTANSVGGSSFSAGTDTAVPEPLTLILLGSGLLGLVGLRRKLS